MVITTRTRPDRNAAPVEVSIRDYLNTFFYYRRIAVTVFLSIVALGIAVALVVPMPYRAQATLLVLLAGYYEQSNSVGGAAVQPALGQLNSVEAQILGSPELHRDVVVSELGPSASEREIAHRLQDFEKRLHIAQNDVANTITLTYSDSNPVAAADQLKHLLAQYFKRRAAIFTSGRVAFLTGQRDEVGAQLKKANDDLLAFEQTHGIVNLDDQMASAITLTGQLVQQKLENDTKLAQNRAELKSVQGSSQGVSATIPLFTDDSEGAHALGTMQVELMQLEAKRADFASRYLPTSPFVAQLDKQIADTRAAIAKQNKQAATATRMGHNTYYDTVQARLADLNANIAGEAAQQQVLDQQIKDARTNQQRLSDIASQFRQLQAARDILGDSFKERSRAVELATIQEGQASQANSTNVRVIQAPFPPSERVVSGGMIIEAAIAAGLVIAGLVVLILASLRETFLSPEQVERSLLLPVLNAPVAVGGGPARRAALFGAAALIAAYLQIALGHGPLAAGLLMIPWTATLFLVAPVAGSFVDRFGPRPFIAAGLFLQAAGMAWIALIADGTAYLELVPPLIIGGVGVSMAMPAAQAAVVGSVPPAGIGKAAGVHAMMRGLGAVFGIAIVGAVFAAAGSLASAASFAAGFPPAIAACAVLSLTGAAAGATVVERRYRLRSRTGVAVR